MGRKKEEAALTLRVFPVMQGQAYNVEMLREMDEWHRRTVLRNLEMAVKSIKEDIATMAAHGGRMPLGEDE